MIQPNFPQHLAYAAQVAARTFDLIKRALMLTEAVVAVTAGTTIALLSAAFLRLSDTALLHVTREVFGSGTLPPPEDARTILLVAVFGALIWAAGGCRRTREWFERLKQGGAR
jgi:hypothetical protein